MRTILGATAHYFTSRPMLAGFFAVGAADLISRARLALMLPV